MQAFEYPPNHPYADSWLTVRLPLFFHPLRGFLTLVLVWLVALLPAIFWCAYADRVGSEGWYALVWSSPVLTLLIAIHILDRINNPVVSRLAWTTKGRALLDYGTGCRRSAEEFLRHERTWAAHYAAQGDDRADQHACWDYILTLEQDACAEQAAFLVRTSPAT